jgi:ureidoglycolate hydrolase
VLHTSLAERQFEIDRLERSVTAAQGRFDVLRQERAELRSPTRLSAEATRIGMHPAATSQFVPVDGLTVAVAIAATGELLDDPDAIESFQPLDQFRLVKAVSAEAP